MKQKIFLKIALGIGAGALVALFWAAIWGKNLGQPLVSPTGHGFSFEPAVVLDPGHGGMDGGAVSQTGIEEKNINLSIAHKTRMLLKLVGIDCVMTRDNDICLEYREGDSVRKNKQRDLYARAQVAQRFPQSDFISIHLNKFEQAQYKGAQMFYGKNSKSLQLAQLMQDSFRQLLDLENDRKIKPAPEAVYIMQKVEAPAVIAECGFLSNPQEAQALTQSGYQTKCALAIMGAYLQFRE